MESILITGSAGFIGFHLAHNYLLKNHQVVGIDGLTDYYDVKIKKKRQAILKKFKNFKAYEIMLEDSKALDKICLNFKPKIIIHLAAQAGVRYSFENPEAYVKSNLLGFFNILEIARKSNTSHLLLASTSSVYGSNFLTPFYEKDKADLQLSFYAATKKSNESMSHAYSFNYKIPITVLRFFTVYGPWGRPDMALFQFTKSILSDEPIDIYNFGNMKRDFTYIDDLIKSIFLLIDKAPKELGKRKTIYKNDSISNVAPWRIVNIGNSKSVNLIKFIETLEKTLGKKSKKNYIKMQMGDVKETFSNTDLLKELTGFRPNKLLSEGIKEFVKWYLTYFKK